MSRLEHFDRNFRERWAESSAGSILMNSLPVKGAAVLGSWAVEKYAEFFGPTGRVETVDADELAQEALRRNALMKQWELARLIEKVKAVSPEKVAIVCGGREALTFALAHSAAENAIIITLDKHNHHPRTKRRIESYAGPGQSIYPLNQDPHHVNAAVALASYVQSGELDLLYLDGERTYGTIQNHWNFFSQYVKPGGLIAIHGISGTRLDRGQDVPGLWAGLKRTYHFTEEIIEPADIYGTPSWGGIGLVEMPDNS